jgi:hypothetical protein
MLNYTYTVQLRTVYKMLDEKYGLKNSEDDRHTWAGIAADLLRVMCYHVVVLADVVNQSCCGTGVPQLDWLTGMIKGRSTSTSTIISTSTSTSTNTSTSARFGHGHT